MKIIDIVGIVLRILLMPFDFFLVKIPKIFGYFIYKKFEDRIKITRKNCVFILNPLSGKQIGQEAMDIFKEKLTGTKVINLLDGNYLEQLEQLLQETPKSEKLNVIIGGGDGSISSLIKEFHDKIKEYKRLVFLPFPLGLGNDFSIQLNFGGNMDIHYMYNFFDKLNSNQTKESEIDSWIVTFTQNGKKIQKLMLLYFGLGCQASTCKTYDTFRKCFPFMCKMNKTNRLFYAFSHFRHWFVELYEQLRGSKGRLLTDIKYWNDGNEIDVSDIGDMVVMSAFSRCGGTSGEWNKNLKKSKYSNNKWTEQNITDQKMEVLSHTNYSHLAGTTVFLSEIDSLCQGSHMKWRIGNRPFTFHIDGEPETWEGPTEIEIKFHSKVSVLKFN